MVTASRTSSPANGSGHGPQGDDEPNAPAVLYWFRTVRRPDKTVDFMPYLIDSDSGVGTQVAAADLNRDGLPDVIVGNKKGVFVFIHQTRPDAAQQWLKGACGQAVRRRG